MVKNLFLIRHSEALSATKATPDFKRKLSNKGLQEAYLVGTYLNTLSVNLDVIYTSPAIRTLETCEQILSSFDEKPRVITAEEYYEATRNVLVAAITQVNDLFNNVAIVGHNPSIALLHEYLTSNYDVSFTTGACAWLKLDIDSWAEVCSGVANAVDFYTPGSIGLE
jgi:phosphohistidine phosphatase